MCDTSQLDSAFSLLEGTEIVEGVIEVVITVCAILGGPSMKSLSQTFETRESQMVKEERTAIWLKDLRVDFIPLAALQLLWKDLDLTDLADVYPSLPETSVRIPQH